jgi:hypothetical protein
LFWGKFQGLLQECTLCCCRMEYSVNIHQVH